MTADAERPILFSGPMVRALLAGTKTQTRRVVKPQPPGLWMKPETAVITDHHGRWAFSRIAPNGMAVAWPRGTESIKCPYGVPGDTLWVRETWAIWHGGAFYRADEDGKWPGSFGDEPKWKPSIHMPRWASRITLRVTDVRVQRVRAITETDAKAEGLSALTKDGGRLWKYGVPDRDKLPGNDDDGWHWREWDADPRVAFRKLWDSINDARGYGWDVDPWVWALTFERVTP